MKIDQNKKNLSQFHTLSKTGVHEVRRGAESLFDEELTHRQDESLQYKIKELLSEIDKTTERLKKSISIHELMTYKKLVKNFLKEASSQAYQVETRRSRSRRGRTIMITVKTIDEEVENVIQDFMKKRSEPMDILTALDKIRGMLVDLMI
ncbi:MAG: YaaR family protein [Bacillota bacterium]|nr:YaaR family protein [Bacillota bacterium]